MPLSAYAVCEIAAEIRLQNTHSDPTTTRLDVAVNRLRCFPPRQMTPRDAGRLRWRGNCGQRWKCGVDRPQARLVERARRG